MTGSDNTDLILPYVHLGDLARAAGDLAQAEADYDRAAAIAGRTDEAERALGLPLLRRGELRLARGDLDAALADLTAAREHLERPGPPLDRGAARFALARALAARGEQARARELAALALADDGGLRDDARAEVRRSLDGVSPASPR